MALKDKVYDEDAAEQRQPYLAARPGNPDTTPAGNPTDPTNQQSDYDPQTTPLNDPSDPRSDLNNREKSFYNPNDDSGPSNLGDVRQAEQGTGNNGGFYNAGTSPGNKKRGIRTLIAAASPHRGKLLVGTGVGGGIAALLFSMFMALIPLKIEHIMANVQRQFFSTSERAVEQASQKMLAHYYAKVLPKYRNCGGTTRNKNCEVTLLANGNNPVRNMYRQWAEARLENTLATKYGIEFRYDKITTSWYLKAPGTAAGKGDKIGPEDNDLADKIHKEFERPDRNTVRNAVRDAMEKETGWKRVMYRYKVGRLLENKYGIKRCMVFCGTRDAIDDAIDDKKNVAKFYIIERVLIPRTEITGLALRCLLDDNCRPDDPGKMKTDHPDDPAKESTGGAPVSDFEAEGRNTLGSLAASYGKRDSKELRELYNEIDKRGFKKFLVEKVMTKLFGETAGKVAAQKTFQAIPIIGWIDFIGRTINTFNNAGPKLKALSYLTNAPAAVAMYNNYRTYADEIHTGNVDAAEVGSFTASLGAPSIADSQNPELKGGTASAEQNPLYNDIVGNSASPSVGFIDMLKPQSAIAATASKDSKTYKCDDGKPPAGASACDEETLGGGTGIANGIHDLLNLPGINLVTHASALYTATFGKLVDLAGSAVSWPLEKAISAAEHLCGVKVAGVVVAPDPLRSYCAAKPVVENIAGDALNLIVTKVFPNPWGDVMSGGRVVGGIFAGASIAGKDACTQIGCEKTSAITMAEIINQQVAEDTAKFNQKSFYARMFDTSTSYSLVSRVAMRLPDSSQAGAASVSNVASVASSPFGSIFGSFASVFSKQQAFAANPTSVDPYGVGTTAFPLNEIPDDPEKYWDEHNCGDDSDEGPIKKWQEESKNNLDDNGQPVHTRTEPCLLIKHTVGNLGAKYDKDLLLDDEKNIGRNGSGGVAASDSSERVGGDAQELAKQLLDAAKDGQIIFHVLNPADNGDGSTPEQNLKDTAAGREPKTSTRCPAATAPSTRTMPIDKDLLKFLVDLSRDTKIEINALVGLCHSASSNHYKGKAVDFDCPLDTGAADRIGKKYGVSRNFENCTPAGNMHYHYSLGGS